MPGLPASLGGTTLDITCLKGKGGNENALKQAPGLGKAAETKGRLEGTFLPPSPTAWRVLSKEMSFRDGGNRPLTTPGCHQPFPDPCVGSEHVWRALNLDEPR